MRFRSTHSHSRGSHGDASVSHGHVHGAVDPSIAASRRGIWAVKWSFLALFATAAVQVGVVLVTGSVALLADTIHNFGDAATAIPLWIAFRFAQLRPSRRFTYGYGRVEDLAGIFIVLVILSSGVFAAYEAIDRLLDPREVEFVWAVAGAGVVGFVGNEAVALFRVRVGKQIGSAALVADGYHARIDGLTSLGVTAGAIAVWVGWTIADPIAALVITALILRIVWQSSGLVFGRLLDRIDPEVIEEITHAAGHVRGVREVTDVRARWSGHRLHAELNIAVSPDITVEQGHRVAAEVRHQISHHLVYMGSVVIHVDPATASGNRHHAVATHEHDGLPAHSHPE